MEMSNESCRPKASLREGRFPRIAGEMSARRTKGGRFAASEVAFAKQMTEGVKEKNKQEF